MSQSDTNTSTQESRRLVATDDRIEAAGKALEAASILDREIIRERQQEEAEKQKKDTMGLLRNYLPSYVFVVNPDIKAFPKGSEEAEKAGIPPTIIEQEVARAQAAAEINVYLSYLSHLDTKAKLLQEWEVIRKGDVKHKNHSTKLMIALQKEIHKAHGKPVHGEGPKKGNNFYHVHELDPLPRTRKVPKSGVTTRTNSVATQGGMANYNVAPQISVLPKSGSAKSGSPDNQSPKSSSPAVKRAGEKTKKEQGGS